MPVYIGVVLYPAEGDSRMIILSLCGKVIRERRWKFSGEAMEISRLRLSLGRFRRSGGGGGGVTPRKWEGTGHLNEILCRANCLGD